MFWKTSYSINDQDKDEFDTWIEKEIARQQIPPEVDDDTP